MQIVELKLTPVHLRGSCPSIGVKAYLRKDINVGFETTDVQSLQVQDPDLEPTPLKKYSYGDVELTFEQDVFHCFRPLEYFETERKSTPMALRLPLGWILNGPLPSASSLFSTIFADVTPKKSIQR